MARQGLLMPDQLEYLLLGPFQVRRNGEILDLGGPQRQALLAALLSQPGRAVPTRMLADEIEAIWECSNRTYGAPRVWELLLRQGYRGIP